MTTTEAVKVTHEIKHRFSGELLFKTEAASLKLAVQLAVTQKVSLRGAYLSGAYLRGAYLSGAYLSGADLSGADLSGAYLRGADLSGVNLRDAKLNETQLAQFRDDFWAVLSGAPREVRGVIAALKAGKVDGSTYTGECSCLVGTIAKAQGCEVDDIKTIKPSPSRYAEVWFAGIKRGDTPESNPLAAQAVAWAEEWLKTMRAAFAPRKK
jgi:hypothetical protein